MLKNTAKSLYASNVSQAISYFDKEIPQILNKVFYSSTFLISLLLILSYFTTYLLLIPLGLLVISFIINFKFFKSDLKLSEEIESFLKIKMSSLLDDVITGNMMIKAGNLELYFGIKLGLLLEKRVLIDIYKIGLKYLISLRAYILNIGLTVLPVYLLIFFSYESGNEDYKNSLLMAMVLINMVPPLGDVLLKSMDEFYLHVCEIDDCLAITNFDSEVKVLFFH